MYVFVGIPEASLTRRASAVMFGTAVLAGGSWLLALSLSWLIGRNLFLKNLRMLTDAASRFGAGHLTTPTGVDHAAGELGQMAEALDRMANQLRSADLDRGRLQQQLTQAQKLESVGRLAGGVAHDFNNMLMVILGQTELLLEQTRPGDASREGLEAIHQAAGKSAELTRQLLAFARKQTIAPVVLDLNETVAGMLKMLQRLIGENVRVVWKPGAHVWPIKADPAQVAQIVANLAVNARDAIDGVGTLTMVTQNVATDTAQSLDHGEGVTGDYVMLSVADDGCGMDTATLSRLFEPFFTTKGPGRGTGLGLATVYGVMKQNGGNIQVDSEPGRGTCFRLYFPSYFGDAPADEDGRPADIPLGHGELILLVEDEASILRVGKAMLERLGYRVVAAASPREALGLLAEIQEPVRLLLTDVVMPDMNGRELASRVLAVHPTVACLYTSGYTSDVVAHGGILDEGIHLIEKPFTVRALATKVRQVLDEQSA
jgi:signal transduction histidine kinase/CheY-like chemotaxis protein